ncbi:hypothetical protein BMW24_003590 [Mycobacterium heckeshornense]|uniref:hypothetical protein n=1 Tax=Mycobacterium heckeshornense TaxID=110505 RepID=UPI0008FCF7AB|nr:hypothetical protein [Mycobacterium heckeshornense]PIJ36758.1 hypothetical protein BMW24_003305 [Mycobacterium heckeshornense]PIJ36809.1 hypothetical protein BMW24_003590 [Mycobacterium heckeshornense]
MANALHNVTEIGQRPAASIVYVTPEMAERWLGHNKVNRNLRNRRVDQFARDMRSGRWQLTGEAIKFGKSGNLIDGQHRLWAVIESGCTVPMFVVRGVQDEVQGVLDSGSARTAADNLGMTGHKNANLVASIARRRISLSSFNNVTNAEVYDFVEEHPEIAQAATIACRYAKRCDIIPSTVGLAAWRIADVHDWFVADDFFCAAAEKVGLTPGDPVLAMTAFFGEQRRNRRHLSLEAQLSAIIRAFNYRYQGKSLRLIRIASSAGGVIPVPEVIS